MTLAPPIRPEAFAVSMNPLHVPEEQMTWRARAYLAVGSLRHIALGASGLALADTFQSDAFKILFDVFSLELWSILFLAGGLHLAYAAGKGSTSHARVALILSACMTAAWAVGFILAFHAGGVVSPLGGILFSALVLKDLVQCGQPLRSPFEPIVRKYVRRQSE